MSKTFNIAATDDWFRGEDKQIKIAIVDADDAPLDISGFTLRWTLETDAGVDVIEKTTGNGITVENGSGTNDRAVIAIDAADTESLDPATYRHALWRTDSPAAQVLSEGSAVLKQAAEADA